MNSIKIGYILFLNEDKVIPATMVEVKVKPCQTSTFVSSRYLLQMLAPISPEKENLILVTCLIGCLSSVKAK
jgi:hypothetical protein